MGDKSAIERNPHRLDFETIERSRRLRARYVAGVHVLAAVASLMVVGQYRHIDHLNWQRGITYELIRTLAAEQKRVAELKLEVATLKRTVLRRKIIAYIRAAAPRRPARRIADAILDACEAHDVDPLLFVALVQAESGFDPRAESHTRARGLAQIVKSTAADLGLPWHRAYQIEPNVYHGAKYLRWLLDQTGDDTALALRRYNGNYDPRYPAKVLAVYDALARR
jgi:soluble lytic murein transglycosylase-like protein